MKKVLKRLMAGLLLAITLIPVCLTAASAASTKAYDVLTDSKYAKVYTLNTSGRTIPYTSKNLTTRGTVSYGKSASSYIDNKADELYLMDVGKTNGTYWAYVSYPSGSRRVNAYIRLSDLTGNNGSHAAVTSTGKFYCARRLGSSTSSSYYVAKGDKVYLLATSGSWYQIMYPISGGKYRIAWCTKTDYNRYCSGKTTTTTPSPNPSGSTSASWDAKIGKTVASIKSGSKYTKYYNSTYNISAAGGYTGQCTWYAWGRFYEVTGVKLKTAPHAKYWLDRNASDKNVTVLRGAEKIQAKSIAVRTTGTWGHVLFVEHVTYKNGSPAYVYFTECNADGNGKYNSGTDCILKRLTYSDFVSQKNPAGYIVKK